jgi:hypothetical protein
MDGKLVAAAGFAGLGVVWGAWGILGGGEADHVRGAERGRAAPAEVIPVDSAGNAVTPEYEATRKNADGVIARIAAAAFEGAKGITGFGTQGDGAAGEFGLAVESVVGPLVRGDHDGFLAAMRAAGAVIGEIEGEHPLFKAIAARLAGAEVDVSRVETRAYEARQMGGPGGAGVERQPQGSPGGASGDGAGAEGEPQRRTVSERVQEMRAGRMFPAAMDGLDEKAVEVRFPFKPRAEPEQWLGIVFVWSREHRAWQPASYRVMTRGATTTAP